MTAHDGRIDARDWSLLAALSVLWGGSFFFNGVVLRELPPFTLVLLRVALAAAILLPVLYAQRLPLPRTWAGWQPFFLVALFNNVLPFSLIVTGQTYIPSGLVSILNATTPLFTVMVMAAAGEERLYLRRVTGVIVGLIGVIILRGGGARLREQAGARYPALPRCGAELWHIGADRTTLPCRFTAACHRYVSTDGIEPDDISRRRRF